MSRNITIFKPFVEHTVRTHSQKMQQEPQKEPAQYEARPNFVHLANSLLAMEYFFLSTT